MALPVPEKVTLKDPKDFRIIGRPTPRLDARAKCSGQQDFGIDVRLPGQLTAVVAHPPVFGARLAAVDDSAARAVKGVKVVLRVPLDGGAEGVAVVADGYWPASQGREALKLQWDTSAIEKVDSERNWPSTANWPAGPARATSTPNGAVEHSAPTAGSRVRVSVPRPRAHGAAELHRAFSGTAPSCGPAPSARDWTPAPRRVCLALNRRRSFVRRWRAAVSAGGSHTSDYVVEACEVAKAARAAGLMGPSARLEPRG